MTPEERVVELAISVMQGSRPMTDARIAKAIHRRHKVTVDAGTVKHVLAANPRRFRRIRPGFLQRLPRWALAEAGPATDPGAAGSPVPAWPYRPSLAGGAAAMLTFRDDEPPTSAVSRG
jgi:hypothetical protein